MKQPDRRIPRMNTDHLANISAIGQGLLASGHFFARFLRDFGTTFEPAHKNGHENSTFSLVRSQCMSP